jgi:hypothetical protein
LQAATLQALSHSPSPTHAARHPVAHSPFRPVLPFLHPMPTPAANANTNTNPRNSKGPFHFICFYLLSLEYLDFPFEHVW